MVALNGFNAGQVAPSVGFEPWPGGWYPVVIKASAEKPTNKKDGFYLEFAVEAIDGPMRGRTNFIRHNWKNPSADAVRIANEQMSAMLHVIGNLAPQDTQQLHGIPFLISYKLDPTGNNGVGSNEVNGYKDIAGNGPTPGQPSTAGQQGGGHQQQQPPQTYGNPNGQPGGQPGGWGGNQNGQPQGQPPAGFQGQPQNNGQPPQGGYVDPNAGQYGQPQGAPQGQPDGAGWGVPPGGGQPPQQQGQPQGQPPQGGWNQGGQPTTPAAQSQPPAGWGGPGGAPQGGNPQWGGPQGGQQ